MSKLEENLELQKSFREAIDKFYEDRKGKGVIIPSDFDALYTGLNSLILLDISESLAMIADSLHGEKGKTEDGQVQD